jgi:ATP-dependent Clp protease adaptor protein ClpS
MTPVAAPTVDHELDIAQRIDPARPWQTVVWDDPVNLMSYVTYVFRSYFGYPEEKARSLMLEVHHHGRSVVASGSLEEAETHTAAMHGFGLWATFEQAGGR